MKERSYKYTCQHLSRDSSKLFQSEHGRIWNSCREGTLQYTEALHSPRQARKMARRLIEMADRAEPRRPKWMSPKPSSSPGQAMWAETYPGDNHVTIFESQGKWLGVSGCIARLTPKDARRLGMDLIAMARRAEENE